MFKTSTIDFDINTNLSEVLSSKSSSINVSNLNLLTDKTTITTGIKIGNAYADAGYAVSDVNKAQH